MNRSRFIASVAAALVAGIVLGGVGISVGLTGAPTPTPMYASARPSEPIDASRAAVGTPTVPTTMTPRTDPVRPTGPATVDHTLCDSRDVCPDPAHDCLDPVTPTNTQTQSWATSGSRMGSGSQDSGASASRMDDDSSDGYGHMSGGDHDDGHR